ncbi:hypothetical protein Lbir_2982 [Legionella birminghamensis]|uniref:Transmembrane protein n=1 Tax=Legionella birminghamensis TaxID=28083 RepID=A0A378IF94_9GAMM|nr:hypothetical protein [Legionella birminghamensis]KTC68380.1 hypothetical protein Lbir_2982 [Legionella birminghamensis]STX30904.1 Uncharacterised protein [Legionella birminghamensis]
MSKERRILLLKNWVERLILHPQLYVSGVISALLSGSSGGIIGFFSGGFIAQSFSLCNSCNNCFLNLNPTVIVGALLGLGIGAIVGGGLAIAITSFKIYKRTKNYPLLSPDNIVQIISASLWINAEILIGMDLGAIIGSLKSAGIGTLTGAILGLLIIWLTSTLKSSRQVKKPVKN